MVRWQRRCRAREVVLCCWAEGRELWNGWELDAIDVMLARSKAAGSCGADSCRPNPSEKLDRRVASDVTR
jgi:hypothetical protein